MDSSVTTVDCLRNQIFCLKLFGLSDNPSGSLVYRIYSISLRWFFLFVGSTLQLMYILSVDNFKDLSENFFVSAKFCTVSLKIFLFSVNIANIHQFMRRFEAPVFQPRNGFETNLLVTATTFSKRLSLFFLCTVLSAASLVIVLPVLEWKRRLPFLYWYPFDIDAFISNFFYFGVLYVFHSISGWTAAGLDISIDALIYGLLIIVKYQLLMLGHRLQHTTNLKENLQIHWKILSLIKDFKKYFNGILFVQITQSVVVLSMTMFQLTLLSPDSIEFSTKIAYIFSIFFQMSVFCYLGNEITFLSMGLSTNAYLTEFRSFNKSKSKSFVILLDNLQNAPIWIQAIGIFTISLTLPTLVGILKMSYSYVVLMHTMATEQ